MYYPLFLHPMTHYSIAFLLSGVLLLSVLGLAAQTTRIERYDPMLFSVKLTHLKNTLIDVRTAHEFAQGHLKGAKQIDWEGREFKQTVDSLPKFMPLFVYCQGGYRSNEAVEVFTKCGFTTVVLLEGGFDAWVEAGLPYVSRKAEPDQFSVPQEN